MPVYNGEKTLKRCLDSLADQKCARDVEIVIINDGSIDLTGRIIDEFIQRHSEQTVKVINKKNEGLPQARKTGIQNASCDIIGFVDADDWVERDYFQQLLKKMESDNVDIVCAGFTIDTDENSQLIHEQKSDKSLDSMAALKNMHDRTAVFQYAWNKIYKKQLFRKIEFPTRNVVGEDYIIIVQLLQEAGRVALLDNCGYHYVQYASSMSHVGVDNNFEYGYRKNREIADSVKQKYPEIINSVNKYFVRCDIATCTSMCKGNVFFPKLIKEAQRNTRKALLPYLKDNNIPFIMKISAIVLAFSFPCFKILYSLKGDRKIKVDK